jgi:hypothetical protein
VKPADQLAWLATRLRLERAGGYWLVCVGGGACVAGLLHTWIPLAVGNLAGLAVAAAADRFRRVTPHDVALHLDRALPELEESTSLLLEGAAPAGLAALQRTRVAARWDVARVAGAIPHGELRRCLSLTLGLALLGLVFLKVVPAPLAPGAGPAAPETALASLDIRALTADITPPAYTGARPRRVAAEDLQVEEGARVRWEAEVRGPATAVWLAGSAGDSLPLRQERGTRWRAELIATRSALWRLRAAGPGTLRAQGADVRLAVRPDRAPVLTVVQPAERTLLEPGAVAPQPVEVLATDDYGVDSAGLAVTVASGQGEAVRFRRLWLPFASRAPRGGGLLLRATLDLPGLGLGPGDELYFTAVATDRRVPLPNRSRSGTIFISVRDTTRAPAADLARMALGVEPEYFRSQRQIIIDTEKLLADSARLTRADFRARANDLGIDQGLLRLRYGQFLGEEFEEESSDVGEVHAHDDAENATLLGQTVKDKLRAALSAMWQAELQLRIGEPRAALPHERRALEMIKLVQQDARVYVQRVGFEPAPIEVHRIRLTGKLTDLAGQQRASARAAQESLPAIRAALALLAAPTDPAAPALEAAGQELAALAVDDPAHLAGVRHLRRYLDVLAAGNRCDDCRARVERALYAALPPATATPPRGAPSASPVARRFRALLGSTTP